MVYQNTVAWCAEDWGTSQLLARVVSDDVTAALVSDSPASEGLDADSEGQVWRHPYVACSCLA